MIEFKVAKGQRKLFLHMVTAVASGIIVYGYMFLADNIEASVVIFALTAIGGQGMVNGHANGKEHEAQAKADAANS